ncbi:hypothetical protein HYC85_027489 [Camellia sinensis]|uniref:Cytochrome b5 heme-binding domain-containing protein n=1 Tax=Camellia sinensis TaxID=4442 RepID=A0A7J7G6I1_CAMSI|nr:hypothetical protein HYC85_027489 [Camellia sinensis]
MAAAEVTMLKHRQTTKKGSGLDLTLMAAEGEVEAVEAPECCFSPFVLLLFELFGTGLPTVRIVLVRVFREREKWLATDNLLLCNDCDWDAHSSCFVSASHDRNPVEGLSASPSPLELASAWGVVSASSSNIEAAAAALGHFSSSSNEHSLKIVGFWGEEEEGGGGELDWRGQQNRAEVEAEAEAEAAAGGGRGGDGAAMPTSNELRDRPTSWDADELRRPSERASMEFTLQQLNQYDGSVPSMPIYMAVRGRIFDVTAGKSFYGPGGPYGMFAGKDASRALAKMSKNEEDVCASLDGLSEKEIGVLNDWEKKFEAKYPIVGRVVS